MDPTIMHVAARDMVDFLFRRGGLSPVGYHRLSASEGTRTHQAFYDHLFETYRHYRPETEVPLRTLFRDGDDVLEIEGRCDLLMYRTADDGAVSLETMEDEPPCDFVLEVKTVAAPLDAIDPRGRPLHWAQVLLYTALFYLDPPDVSDDDDASGVLTPDGVVPDGEDPDDASAHDTPRRDAPIDPLPHAARPRTPASDDEIPFGLAYVSRDTLEARFLIRVISREELHAWFLGTCRHYLQRARDARSFREARDASIEALSFPYARLRDGQRDLMAEAIRSIRQTTPLLAEAPTGIGKTMATLYPSVKTLPGAEHEHIFYLTAKASARRVADEALALLTEQGLRARRLIMTAKEKICLAPDYFCDKRSCPYAIHYYDHLPEAEADLLPHLKLDRARLEAVAAKHRVCPFELQLDIAEQCDIIIGDYNHAFDPRVQLDRFFGTAAGKQLLLVDEAHNLVDRSRDMFSLTWERQPLAELLPLIHPGGPEAPARFPELEDALKGLLAYFDHMAESVADDLPGFDTLEPSLRLGPGDIAQAEGFRAIRRKPEALKERLQQLLRHIYTLPDLIEDLTVKRQVVERIAEASFAFRILEEFWDATYILCYRSARGMSGFRLLCLDVSSRIADAYRNRHGAIFFSATLTPLSYFRRNFCGSSTLDRPNTLQLASPFPADHLKVLIMNGIQTTWKERAASRKDLAQAIALTAVMRKGHQLCFFPSFAYLRQTLQVLQPLLKKYRLPIIVQTPGMSDQARDEYLAHFLRDDGKPLIGFAVMGGIFGEGIDLMGEALETVQIVGVGLPQLSPERELMMQYYNERMEPGFNYAYRFPGFNKVLQAAGRLIRSEQDTGVLILYDARFSLPEYRALMPEHWEPETVSTLPALKDALAALLPPPDTSSEDVSGKSPAPPHPPHA